MGSAEARSPRNGNSWEKQLITDLKYKLRKTEDTVKALSDDLIKRDRESSMFKAECEQLKAQAKLNQSASYMKIMKKLDKVAPRA